jgi:heat shock protein HspQ
VTDLKQIPHLIKLLDDDTPDIRNQILQELASFGPTLYTELKKLSFPLSSVQKENIRIIIEGQKRVWLKQVWPSWVGHPCAPCDSYIDYGKLEKGVAILATFLSDTTLPTNAQRVVNNEIKLRRLLNGLAYAYRRKFHGNDSKRLASFLFGDHGFQGDEEESRYNNLIYVVQTRNGIPLSMVVVYMLVGWRLGLTIDGCHFPGHFLARFDAGGRSLYVDCFNGGQLLEEKDLLYAEEGIRSGIQNILTQKVDEETIMRCFLTNLARSFQLEEDDENADLMALFKDLDRQAHRHTIARLTPEDIISQMSPRFTVGQLVLHNRYGYRGIIVEIDSQCNAPDQWYYGNQTQPSRSQPWYHVLVDGSKEATYVAENKLETGLSHEKIDHPLVPHFFDTINGRYVRNDNPWPGTDF